jgi:hypothetical protein
MRDDLVGRLTAWGESAMLSQHFMGTVSARETCAKAADEITRLRAQVEQFRDTNRRMNRRLQLLEGWWQRKVDRSKSERALLFDRWCRDHRGKEPNLKAMEEVAYQRGYADGFDAKFFIPKRATYQKKREAGNE